MIKKTGFSQSTGEGKERKYETVQGIRCDPAFPSKKGNAWLVPVTITDPAKLKKDQTLMLTIWD